MLDKVGGGYTFGNRDNVEQAVKCLDEFTYNWCMNCKETEKQGEPVFRCDECQFAKGDGTCLVKAFKVVHMPEYKNFGCMGDL